MTDAFTKATIGRIEITRFDAVGEHPAMIRAKVFLRVSHVLESPNSLPSDQVFTLRLPITREGETLPEIEARAVQLLRSSLRWMAETI